MQKELNLVLPPEIALDKDALKEYLSKTTKAKEFHFRVNKQALDARNRNVKVLLQVDIDAKPLPTPFKHDFSYKDVSSGEKVIIVGCGPAGMFAALRLIELGLKPIILERGSEVRKRRRDLAAINKNHHVNPESNYCFGEGGAGTYSDGKLYTRSKKRGEILRVLEILVRHGATEQILVEAHPHIGTNKLPAVVTALRETILNYGGEIHFDTKAIDLLLEGSTIKGVLDQNGVSHTGIGVILATGHSARDIFKLLQKKEVFLEAKPFALGVRIEHPQSFVDQCQYHRPERGLLPAAAYSLVTQTHFKGIKRGVFSFCMCPGGFIVPSSTAPGEIVVNGMSPSRRDSKFANSGVVVAINPPDWEKFKSHGPLAALQFQEEVEKTAWNKTLQFSPFGQENQIAPAQRVADFLQKKTAGTLNSTSYQPGLSETDMFSILPDFVANSLAQGIKDFGKRMKGYATNTGQLIGIESRTSSPVRIPREKDSLEHPFIQRLFPCGEGAGYAGGIVSAAMDGEKCAEAITKLYKK